MYICVHPISKSEREFLKDIEICRELEMTFLLLFLIEELIKEVQRRGRVESQGFHPNGCIGDVIRNYLFGEQPHSR